MRNSEEQSPEDKKNAAAGAGLSMGIGVGMALGAGIGVALDNLALGIGIGIAIGAGIGAVFAAAAKNRPSYVRSCHDLTMVGYTADSWPIKVGRRVQLRA